VSKRDYTTWESDLTSDRERTDGKTGNRPANRTDYSGFNQDQTLRNRSDRWD
jgi:hypothetical protein